MWPRRVRQPPQCSLETRGDPSTRLLTAQNPAAPVEGGIRLRNSGLRAFRALGTGRVLGVLWPELWGVLRTSLPLAC